MELPEEYLDEDIEYLNDQCPDCLIVFPTDEELLAHICKEQRG